MFHILYSFPSYFHHVTAFRWSRPAYLALDSLLSPSRTLLTCLAKCFHVVFSCRSPILCRDTSTLEVFLHYWQLPWLCSLGFAWTIKSLSWYPIYIFLLCKGLLPVCRIILSCHSLFLHPSLSSSHSEASSKVFPMVLWIWIHITHYHSHSYHKSDFPICLPSSIIVLFTFYIEPIHCFYFLIVIWVYFSLDSLPPTFPWSGLSSDSLARIQNWTVLLLLTFTTL